MEELNRNPIQKSQFQSFNKFSYRGIDDIYNAMSPLFVKYQVICIPRVTERKVDHIEKKSEGKGKEKAEVVVNIINERIVDVTVSYTFIAVEDGSSLETIMSGDDSDASKAQSLSYRENMIKTFCIPVDAPHLDPTPPPKKDEKIITSLQRNGIIAAMEKLLEQNYVAENEEEMKKFHICSEVINGLAISSDKADKMIKWMNSKIK